MSSATENTFGLRGVRVYDDCCCNSSGLCAQSLEIKPQYDENELQCGGTVISLGSTLARLDFSLEHTGINLAAFAIMTGTAAQECCSCDTCGGIGCQSCNDVVKRGYLKGGSASPYFQILGMSTTTDGRPIQIQIPRAKIRSGPNGVFTQDKYFVSTLSGSAIPDDDGNLAIITELETGAEYKLSNTILHVSAGGCAPEPLNGGFQVTSGTFDVCCGATLHFGSDTLNAAVDNEGRVCFEIDFQSLISSQANNGISVSPQDGKLYASSVIDEVDESILQRVQFDTNSSDPNDPDQRVEQFFWDPNNDGNPNQVWGAGFERIETTLDTDTILPTLDRPQSDKFIVQGIRRVNDILLVDKIPDHSAACRPASFSNFQSLTDPAVGTSFAGVSFSVNLPFPYRYSYFIAHLLWSFTGMLLRPSAFSATSAVIEYQYRVDGGTWTTVNEVGINNHQPQGAPAGDKRHFASAFSFPLCLEVQPSLLTGAFSRTIDIRKNVLFNPNITDTNTGLTESLLQTVTFNDGDVFGTWITR